MSETWKRWEGQSVNGELPLLRYLGGSRHSAVFVTKRKADDSELVAIKLIASDPGTADRQLQRWKQAAELVHPNLIRIRESGRCELESTLLLYVVMELAEEDLSQILPERALSPAEVREMLPPVLDALATIHAKGMAHGRVRPSNILAIGNVVKVSTDTLRTSGDLVAPPDGWGGYDPPESSSRRLTTAADVWSLAITLVQILTQQRPLWHPAEPAAPSLPEQTPEPFREIAQRCLQVDPKQRCTIAEIAAVLQPKQSSPVAAVRPKHGDSQATGVKKKSIAWAWVLGVIAVVVVMAFIVLSGNKARHASSSTEPVPTAPPPSPSPQAASEPSSLSSSSSSSLVAEKPTGKLAPNSTGKGAVLERIMPRVSASSRRTIEGKIKVGVSVKVDASGNVEEAKLISPGPSQYFARLALDAAREWKFSPAHVQGQAVESEWKLQFGFRRSGTDVVSTETAPR